MTVNLNPAVSPSSLGTNSAQNFERIGSGQRINSAADDAAGLIISTEFGASITGDQQAIRNANDAISATETAGGALNTITEDLQRIRELSVQSANGTLNDADRQGLQAEVDQLVENINETISDSDFNGQSLLSGSAQLDVQIGGDADQQLTIEGADLGTVLDDLGLNSIDISTAQGASDSLGVLDDSLQAVSDVAAELGAGQGRLESSINNLSQNVISESASNSRIRDADLAKEISDLAAELVRDQVQTSTQAQANDNLKLVMRLFES